MHRDISILVVFLLYHRRPLKYFSLLWKHTNGSVMLPHMILILQMNVWLFGRLNGGLIKINCLIAAL